MTLTSLLHRLRTRGLLVGSPGGFDSRTIDHLAHDSRKVGPDGLFIAVRGETADGHLFIDKAVQNGAVAVVCEAVPDEAPTRFPGTAFVHVRNARHALGHLAAAFYGDPADKLNLIGVTGTNGKTTTSYLVHHALTTLGTTAGLIGTVEVRIGTKRAGSEMTTPDALELHRLFRDMVDAGCTACAMEVSSHALDQHRTAGAVFDVGIFTNLTRDHLDYHGTLDAYAAAKRRLFESLTSDGTAVYNADDEAGAGMVATTPAETVGYGQREAADLRFQVLDNAVDGLHLRLDGMEQQFRLVGLFNAYNLAAAYGALRALGHDRLAALYALAEAPAVPGRFELLRFDDGTTVIVDYAHTPDALENVLATIRTTKPEGAALWCIFGCGGDRDPSKRRVMGTVAEGYADHIIVTSDNPRTEEPEGIMNDIRRGMSRPAEATWLVDRAEAIAYAAAHAAPGDVVLVAGKGHETYQIIGTEKRPFDDREEVRKRFERRTTRGEAPR